LFFVFPKKKKVFVFQFNFRANNRTHHIATRWQSYCARQSRQLATLRTAALALPRKTAANSRYTK